MFGGNFGDGTQPGPGPRDHGLGELHGGLRRHAADDRAQTPREVRDLQRNRRASRHQAGQVHDLRRPRQPADPAGRLPVPGPVPRLRWRGQGDRGSVRHLPGQRLPGPARSSSRSGSRPARGTAAGCGSRARASRARRAGDNGDLIVWVSVEKHPLFERSGDDLLCEIPISLVQATLGDRIDVPTPTGPQSLDIPPRDPARRDVSPARARNARTGHDATRNTSRPGPRRDPASPDRAPAGVAPGVRGAAFRGRLAAPQVLPRQGQDPVRVNTMPASEPREHDESEPQPDAGTPAAQLTELTDKWLRARAELENVRRAARQDVDAARRFGAAPAFARLLDVLDNLQRALAAPPAGVPADFPAGSADDRAAVRRGARGARRLARAGRTGPAARPAPATRPSRRRTRRDSPRARSCAPCSPGGACTTGCCDPPRSWPRAPRRLTWSADAYLRLRLPEVRPRLRAVPVDVGGRAEALPRSADATDWSASSVPAPASCSRAAASIRPTTSGLPRRNPTPHPQRTPRPRPPAPPDKGPAGKAAGKPSGGTSKGSRQVRLSGRPMKGAFAPSVFPV